MSFQGRLLVLGGTGLLGQALARLLGPGRVVLTGNQRRTPGIVVFDALADDPGRLIDDQGPFAAVALMFGITSPDACARKPDAARRLNVGAMEQAILACEARRLPIVFTSSEVVFDGRRGCYGEEDRPAPLMLYGRQKLEVEERLARCTAPAIIARCARVLGTRPGDGTLATGFLERMLRGERLEAAIDQRFSPILDDDAAAALVALLVREATGIFHLGGPEAVSRFDIASRCHRWLVDRNLMVPALPVPRRMREFATLEPRPRDVSLRIDRLVAATGIMPAGLDTIISRCWERRRAADGMAE